MPRLLLFIPCRQALVDNSSNLLSLVSVIESLVISQFPGTVSEMTLAAVWQRNDEEAGVAMIQKVDMVGPDGQSVMAIETPFLFTNIGHRVINRVGGIPFNAPGPYEFRLFIKPQAAANYPEQPMGSYPVLIQVAPSAQMYLKLPGPSS
jgi:hypothetical protein